MKPHPSAASAPGPILTTGLVSITFRELPVERIIELTAEAELDGLEWGGDIHAPPGQPHQAEQVRQQTGTAGLSIIAYGSYYKAGFSPPSEFTPVLQTAVTLEAPVIRVWAGIKGSAESSREQRHRIVTDLHRIAKLAAAENIEIACEYHGNTLNDSLESSRRLMRETAPAQVRSYWQPLPAMSPEEKTEGLLEVLPFLRNIHVYNWHPETRDRLPLAENRDGWRRWLRLVADHGPKRRIACMLEFVRNDDPQWFKTDARTLRELIDRCSLPAGTVETDA